MATSTTTEKKMKVMRRHISRKGSMAKTWLVMGVEGQRQEVEAGRQLIMHQTGLTARDLRILDPMLSYPSTIVARDRAILINLEHIKAIITANQIFLLNSKDPSVIPFLHHLHSRILSHHSSTTTHHNPPPPQDKGGSLMKKEDNSIKILPFEFLTLEACLEAVSTALQNEENVLELEAHPALDKLTSKISTLNLERVRHVKSRLVALTTRVQRVRDELEGLLDDDGAMAELYLTDKLVQQQLQNSSASPIVTNDRITSREISLERGGDQSTTHDDYPSEQIFGASNSEIRETQDGTVCSTNGVTSVAELEMLLGAYFVQIGGTLNKLSALREYVDDTEDYINITLDDKQNRILQTGVKIGTASVLVNSFVAVTGVFGINIHIELFDTGGTPEFLGVIFGCTAACIFLYIVAIAWYKRRSLVD